jgi:hypothetical protein
VRFNSIAFVLIRDIGFNMKFKALLKNLVIFDLWVVFSVSILVFSESVLLVDSFSTLLSPSWVLGVFDLSCSL